MQLIKEISIPNPPTKYVVQLKRKIDKKTGLLKVNTIYLTLNAFYSGMHFQTRTDIVNSCKDFLLPHMIDIPKLKRIRIEWIYVTDKGGFDLDNKLGFWMKIINDLLKEPTAKQIKKANEAEYEIKSLYVIKDDSVDIYDSYSCAYEYGAPCLKIKIFGELR